MKLEGTTLYIFKIVDEIYKRHYLTLKPESCKVFAENSDEDYEYVVVLNTMIPIVEGSLCLEISQNLRRRGYSVKEANLGGFYLFYISQVTRRRTERIRE